MDVRAGQLFCQGPERLGFSLRLNAQLRTSWNIISTFSVWQN